MGLRDLSLQSEYRTKMSDIARDFLVPVLSEAVQYDRAVGFFSSSSLAEVAQGIGRIAMRGGRIRLIASPNLSEEDVQAIERGYDRRERIRMRLLEGLADIDMLGMAEKDRLNMLADLIASGVLDIRIAFAESRTGYGIYHEKVAIVTDGAGDKVAFSGSMNESAAAMRENYEAIDVFRSWDDPEGRVRTKEAAFEAIWDDREPGVSTFDFPEVKEEIVRHYRTARPDYTNDLISVDLEYSGHSLRKPSHYPEMPDEYTLRGYQKEAIEAWRNRGYRGIYDMATGTGKTVTALASIVELCQHVGNELAVVIVCPFQHLVDQWVEDIELFNIDPIIGYSTSPQRDWELRLDRAIRNQRFGVRGSRFLCFVCTNGTYATDRVQRMLGKIKKPKLLVVDEAHNFGAEYLRSLLREDFQFRLALSATIERHGDSVGTDTLFSYFGERCIEYTLEEAIYGRGDEPPCLTPYRYYPVTVFLDGDELQQYGSLSAEIARSVKIGRDGKKRLTERGKVLALRRARLVAGARQKLTSLREAIAPYAHSSFMLVYCGATKVEVDIDAENRDVDDDELRQIDAVTKLLGDTLDMRVRQFTSRENSSERDEIKRMFEREELQALIAIKCLDEGVNIPMIKTAFILASTTNPREYVQRRGRLLRRDNLGRKKRAEIYDFITLPRNPSEASVLPDEDTRGEKRLAYNELVRAKAFASLAENRAQIVQQLATIEESFFGLRGIEGYESEEVE